MLEAYKPESDNMSCFKKADKKFNRQNTTSDNLPDPIKHLYRVYKNLSDDFSQEDIVALYNEFNAYTGNKDMRADEFKLIMQSLNVS